jgi:hypothetical protein
VLQGDGKSYLKIEEGKWTFWVGTPHQAFSVGDTVLMGRGPEKKQFLSADLGRRFKVMTLIDKVAIVSETQSAAAIQLPVPEGGIRIGDLYGQRVALSGQAVVVRGRVVKANMGIFDTNWYHLRDGSGAEGSNDLTVTSQTEVKVGDRVVASGKLTIDKDLGFGYFYDAIIEEGTLKVEAGK